MTMAPTVRQSETPAWNRRSEILIELEARHPESRSLIAELAGCEMAIVNEAEMMGVRRHGKQIIETLFGDRYQCFGFVPQEPDLEMEDAIPESDIYYKV